jgi:hypothetical protein
VKPVATAPDNDIVFMEVVDAAMPVGSWSSLTKRRQRGSRQYNGQQNQDYFFHLFLLSLTIFVIVRLTTF